jgi:prolipoprotein diacylglyceryltransferase
MWLLPVAALLHARRKTSPFLFGEYLFANGAGRIAIETMRLNPKVALGLTEPQWIGIGLMLIGGSSWLYFRAHDRRAARSQAGQEPAGSR